MPIQSDALGKGDGGVAVDVISGVFVTLAVASFDEGVGVIALLVAVAFSVALVDGVD